MLNAGPRGPAYRQGRQRLSLRSGALERPIAFDQNSLIHLVLLHHKAWRGFRLNWRAQHGHRGRVRAIATANLRWSVAIELGTCRSGRIGGAAGSVTTGNARFLEDPGGTRS